MTGGTPRPLSDKERAVVARLLSVPFPVRDELRAQLSFTTVEGRCGCASVNLAVERGRQRQPGCCPVHPCRLTSVSV